MQAAFETLLDEQRLARALQENDAQLHELYEEANIKYRREILTQLGYQNPTARNKVTKMLDQPYVSIDPSVAADVMSRMVMLQEFELKLRELGLEVEDLRNVEDARMFAIMKKQGYQNAFERAELYEWFMSYLAKH